ncbi:MAG: acetyl-CoA carboxylase biotin carboxyl carrier protein [Cetobacterium somerae]|jgi:acetyl-CoA carboxylase biotin carboxyl carrier protein|uniref:Biotin carboxyl carrier protein of acetyl-CoA carboxylase n=1 Tax=Cetobacterium somerae ATCC BAA-474 TaxID=1319815 RepID=U7V800_9FUSO|nr:MULTISPECIES: acetyl-CoA carboxylase biotin carboxyl carrier protein [Cetobacterium]ERT67650.1 acetyl-CoA carboxylase, biotin carboxyl carrier protein [Cetobacterium somerae ATCC BAA-474]MBC2853822.1 acetyl-CoA carboxylase biotin carboxyl carrier protein [Cetobacterium sp. 2G large]MCQ9625615.1 acetyl-CoA carboxylase biotin carboxyl carrier protein [Cetobacterium somerae]WVJ00283.1 acetyl-CoA carboxylase biotin carboxyl carrier protein [Cetobacterium somerae]
MKLDLESVKKLAKSIEEHNLSEISIEVNGTKLTMKKEELRQEVVTSNIKYVEQPTLTNKEIEIEEIESSEEVVVEGKEIVSPMVGTYYSAPSPDSEDFVKIGDKVEVGDTVCIVEAMKMMNEVKSSVAGTVVALRAENGKVVKKGDILFLVK